MSLYFGIFSRRILLSPTLKHISSPSLFFYLSLSYFSNGMFLFFFFSILFSLNEKQNQQKTHLWICTYAHTERNNQFKPWLLVSWDFHVKNNISDWRIVFKLISLLLSFYLFLYFDSSSSFRDIGNEERTQNQITASSDDRGLFTRTPSTR